MRKSIFLAVLVALIFGLCSTAFAFEPVDCYISPPKEVITTNGIAIFRGNWSGGASDDYDVSFSWGDGWIDRLYDYQYLYSYFTHHYLYGVRWNVQLMVTNGNTDYDFGRVICYGWTDLLTNDR